MRAERITSTEEIIEAFLDGDTGYAIDHKAAFESMAEPDVTELVDMDVIVPLQPKGTDDDR